MFPTGDYTQLLLYKRKSVLKSYLVRLDFDKKNVILLARRCFI